jgi:putative glutamine amidotransferase
MKRPRIGITTSYKDDTQTINHYYGRAITQAGGLPIIVPILESAEVAQDFATLLDGLLITGGPAIIKGMIGELPEDLNDTDPVRVQSDRFIFEAMRDKQLLGICYGMQFINAELGGKIYADVQAQHNGSHVHSSGRGAKEHALHFNQDSQLGQLFGSEFTVNSFHVQAIAEPAQQLTVVGTGDDGVIEAYESQDGKIIGVQFHPERMLDTTLPLFEHFVNRCR